MNRTGSRAANWSIGLCRYLILSVKRAARNLKPWSWAAANQAVRTARARIYRNRCQYLPTVPVATLRLPEVQAAVPAVQAVQAQTAVHAINHLITT